MTNRYNSPNVQYFVDPVTGAPLAGGLLYFYVSGTSTLLSTYSDINLTIANTNPVVLDSNGYAGAIFLQNLAYKVVLTDSTGVQQWTQDPVSTSDYTAFAQVKPWSGNPNGQVAGTASTQGSLPGSSMIWDYVNNILYVATTTGNASTTVWTAVNSSSSVSVTPQPTGRLTPTAGTPVINTDAVSSTSLVYTPYIGNTVPIYNGTTMTNQTFSELTLSLTASHAANTIYDVFVFNNSGVLTLITGPAWQTSTSGSGARGTGASTTQISRINGIWTNTVQISGRNGSTTYTVGAGLATYLGSIFIDATAGQVTCRVSYGQNRKFGIWNAYNRVPIVVGAIDPTASWVYATATIRASNGAPASYLGTSFNAGSGTACNGINLFTGLAEETVDIRFVQNVSAGNNINDYVLVGIGLNSTTAFASKVGRSGSYNETSSPLNRNDVSSEYTIPPFLGLNIAVMCEETLGNNTTMTLYGTNTNMLMVARWRG